MSWLSNASGLSVVMACAAMKTSVRKPWRLANASDTSSAAAAPQVGGQAIRRVSTPGQSMGAFITSSTDSSLRSRASGLRDAWRLALARTLAKDSSGVPYFCMWLWPAPPK